VLLRIPMLGMMGHTCVPFNNKNAMLDNEEDLDLYLEPEELIQQMFHPKKSSLGSPEERGMGLAEDLNPGEVEIPAEVDVPVAEPLRRGQRKKVQAKSRHENYYKSLG
jgi:hypothetical protein